MTKDRRTSFIQALRACADFYEQHPTVEAPFDPVLNVFPGTREELAFCARVASWEKVYTNDWFMLRKDFGGLILEINVSRDVVCRKVVTGRKTIPAQPEREVEIVEWVCDEALLAEPIAEAARG